MNNEELILIELKKLTQKVEKIEKQLEQIKNSNKPSSTLLNKEPIEQINSFKPKGGDPWGGNGKSKTKEIANEDPLYMPFKIEESDDNNILEDAKRVYQIKKEELLRNWKENPNKAPQYGIQNECPKCGLKLDNGSLSFSCPNSDCPCGMGPTIC